MDGMSMKHNKHAATAIIIAEYVSWIIYRFISTEFIIWLSAEAIL